VVSVPWEVWKGVRERLTGDLLPVVKDFVRSYQKPVIAGETTEQ